MAVVYFALLVVLFVVKKLLGARAGVLESQFEKLAREARLLQNTRTKDREDAARRQFQWGRVAEKKSRVESKYEKAQGRADKAQGAFQTIAGLRNGVASYVLGACDCFAAVSTAYYLGLGDHVDPNRVQQVVSTWLS